jgi:hypothetical protein
VCKSSNSSATFSCAQKFLQKYARGMVPPRVCIYPTCRLCAHVVVYTATLHVCRKVATRVRYFLRTDFWTEMCTNIYTLRDAICTTTWANSLHVGHIPTLHMCCTSGSHTRNVRAEIPGTEIAPRHVCCEVPTYPPHVGCRPCGGYM